MTTTAYFFALFIAFCAGFLMGIAFWHEVMERTYGVNLTSLQKRRKKWNG